MRSLEAALSYIQCISSMPLAKPGYAKYIANMAHAYSEQGFQLLPEKCGILSLTLSDLLFTYTYGRLSKV